MKVSELSRYALCAGISIAMLAGCGGSQPPIAMPDVASQGNAVAGLPRNLLYVLGGPQSTRHPSIEVFNALDDSKNPQPIYTIGPKEEGEYGLLAVDRTNDLFAVNYFANGANLLIFPAGETRPKIACRLDDAPRDTFITGNTFYFTTQNYTIEEYALPINGGKACPKPTKVLTDQRARLRGYLGLFGMAVDPHGDIFDVWQSLGGLKIDRFSPGSDTARSFASLEQTGTVNSMTSDPRGNVIANFGGEKPHDAIAVFPAAGRPRKLFDPIPNGTYLGVAVADNSTELFATKDYPATTVSAYAYDPSKGRVGRVLRTFASGIWDSAQSIAVFFGK